MPDVGSYISRICSELVG